MNFEITLKHFTNIKVYLCLCSQNLFSYADWPLNLSFTFWLSFLAPAVAAFQTQKREDPPTKLNPLRFSREFFSKAPVSLILCFQLLSAPPNSPILRNWERKSLIWVEDEASRFRFPPSLLSLRAQTNNQTWQTRSQTSNLQEPAGNRALIPSKLRLFSTWKHPRIIC